MKKVSMIMPCYNAGKFLGGMLDSVLSQKYDNIELIIGYDASADDTLEILRSYKLEFESRGYGLKITENASRMGITGGINNALQYVTGDYICFPDSDDRLHGDYCEVMVEALERSPEYGYACCDSFKGNVDSFEYGSPYRDYSYGAAYDDLDIAECTILELIPRAPWRLMVRTEYFRKCFPENRIYPHPTSHELAIRLPLSRERFLYVDKPLYDYYFHEDGYISSRNHAYHTGIPYWDSVEMLGRELIESMPITDAQKDRLHFANRISNLRNKLNVIINSGRIGLFDEYSAQFIDAINEYNPCIKISKKFNLAENWYCLYPHFPAIVAGKFPENRRNEYSRLIYMQQLGRFVLYGAGHQCKHIVLPALFGAALVPAEIWDNNAEKAGYIYSVRVVQPHIEFDANTPIIVTISDLKTAKDATLYLESLGYKNIIWGAAVDEFMSLLKAKEIMNDITQFEKRK